MSIESNLSVPHTERLKIKVCGMRNTENIRQVAALLPDYMGFIFYPGSKRFAETLDKRILDDLPPSIKKTGVFVNASPAEIQGKAEQFSLNAVQLHGSESPETCGIIRAMGVEVIKAFGLDESFDFTILNTYEGFADYFLFDTKTTQHGGSGQVFNWSLLNENNTVKSYFLSGGLGIENIGDIENIEDSRLYALDLNSRFETEPGLKDLNKLKIIFNQINRFRNSGLEGL